MLLTALSVIFLLLPLPAQASGRNPVAAWCLGLPLWNSPITDQQPFTLQHKCLHCLLSPAKSQVLSPTLCHLEGVAFWRRRWCFSSGCIQKPQALPRNWSLDIATIWGAQIWSSGVHLLQDFKLGRPQFSVQQWQTTANWCVCFPGLHFP